MPGWIYTMGVDWNDSKIGTSIHIIGFNPATGKHRLCTRETVVREQWSQHAAIERIISMNRAWRPEWIYIDKGFGGTQYEMITKFGWDNVQKLGFLQHNQAPGVSTEMVRTDARLSRIVTQYDFGSKIETRDPFTKQPVNKKAKPWLVENSVRMFEQMRMEISQYDIQLQNELRGYIIDRLTPSKDPVYGTNDDKIGDHNVDALNLALLAFTMQASAFGSIRPDNHIAFSSTFGKLPQPTGIPQKESDKGFPTSRVDNSKSGSGVVDRTASLHEKSATSSITEKQVMPTWSWPGFGYDAPRPTASPKRGRRIKPVDRVSRLLGNRHSRKK